MPRAKKEAPVVDTEPTAPDPLNEGVSEEVTEPTPPPKKRASRAKPKPEPIEEDLYVPPLDAAGRTAAEELIKSRWAETKDSAEKVMAWVDPTTITGDPVDAVAPWDDDPGQGDFPSDAEIEAFLASEEIAAAQPAGEPTEEQLHMASMEMLDEALRGSHPILGSEYGPAEFVGEYEDGSQEWHEARSKGIGGSDAASILNIGFTSAYKLWYLKKGYWEDDPPDEKMQDIFEWGHLQEEAIATKFTRVHPEWEAHQGGSWRKKDAPWMLANPDRLLINMETGEVSILEIKTSEQGTGWDNDRCPSKYVVQLRHYLWVFGLDYGFLVVKIGNSDYREFRVPADTSQPIEKLYGGTAKPSKFVIEYGDGAYLQQAELNFLQLEEPPAMDGNKDIYEMIRRRNMSLDRGVEVELPVDVGTALAESQAALVAAELANQEARNHVMAHMGTAQYATYAGNRVASRVAKGAAAPYLKVG